MDNEVRKEALRLSYLTVAVGLAECAASLAAGWSAGSVALVGFGLDSLVESLSGSVMIWRFRSHGRLSAEEEHRIESRAARLIGYAFLVLAAYVAYESIDDLAGGHPPERTLFGMAVAFASATLMPMLYVRKRRIGRAIGSRSLVADSKQSLACALLAVAVLTGLGLNYGAGLWEADPVIGLGIVAFLVREGIHTLKEKELCW